MPYMAHTVKKYFAYMAQCEQKNTRWVAGTLFA